MSSSSTSGSPGASTGRRPPRPSPRAAPGAAQLPQARPARAADGAAAARLGAASARVRRPGPAAPAARGAGRRRRARSVARRAAARQVGLEVLATALQPQPTPQRVVRGGRGDEDRGRAGGAGDGQEEGAARAHAAESFPRRCATVAAGAPDVRPARPRTRYRAPSCRSSNEEVTGTVKAYEVMILIDPEVEEARQEEIIARVRDIVLGAGGTWDAVDPWGRRKLAYEIDKKGEAFYWMVRLTCPPRRPGRARARAPDHGRGPAAQGREAVEGAPRAAARA